MADTLLNNTTANKHSEASRRSVPKINQYAICNNSMYRCLKTMLITSVLVLTLMIPATLSQELKLQDNGYEGLMVSISEDIPQEQCKRIVNGLKVNKTLLLISISYHYLHNISR